MSGAAGEDYDFRTAFRESFLWCFREPEHVELLRRVGSALYEVAMEGPYWDWGASHGLSGPRGYAIAAAADLEDLARYLQMIADEPAETAVSRADLGVCRAAAGWAGRVRRLAVDIREEVGEEVAVDTSG